MPQLLTRQHTPEWHTERAKRLTTSDVAAALGLCPYKTRKKLWQEKLGLTPKFVGNVATDWGNECEPNAIADYEAESGRIALPGGFWVHPSIEWLGGSPDGLLGERELLQTKCPYNRTIPDAPPEHYIVQCIAELEVTQRDVNYLHYWTPLASRTFRIERDRAKWADWYPQLERFWTAIQRKEWLTTTPTAAPSAKTTGARKTRTPSTPALST